MRKLGLCLLGVALLAAAIAAGPRGGGPKDATRVGRLEVSIHDFRFDPPTIEIVPGDTVVWTNHDFVPHTATASDGTWDSGSIATGHSWVFVATSEMSVGYLCTFHPAMTGALVVLESRSGPTGG